MATSAFRIGFQLAELYFGKTSVTIPHVGARRVKMEFAPREAKGWAGFENDQRRWAIEADR
jgi:hypothetical protein